jgi:predicted RecB family nuclease
MILFIILVFFILYVDFKSRNSSSNKFYSFWNKIFKKPIYTYFLNLGNKVYDKVESYLLRKYGTTQLEKLVNNRIFLTDVKKVRNFFIGFLVIFFVVSILSLIISFFR